MELLYLSFMFGGIMVLAILILFQPSSLILLGALSVFGMSQMKFRLRHNWLLLKEHAQQSRN